MPSRVILLDSSLSPSTPIERRQGTGGVIALSTSSLVAETPVTISVTVQNIGTTNSNSCTVEFFLKRPNQSVLKLDPLRCNPSANPMAPTGLIVNDTHTFSLTYVLQDGDVGADMLYVQVQSDSPPSCFVMGDPTNTDCECNAEKRVTVVAAPRPMLDVGPVSASLL